MVQRGRSKIRDLYSDKIRVRGINAKLQTMSTNICLQWTDHGFSGLFGVGSQRIPWIVAKRAYGSRSNSNCYHGTFCRWYIGFTDGASDL